MWTKSRCTDSTGGQVGGPAVPAGTATMTDGREDHHNGRMEQPAEQLLATAATRRRSSALVLLIITVGLARPVAAVSVFGLFVCAHHAGARH